MSAYIADNPLFSPLFEDDGVSRIFSGATMLERMLAFETALTIALRNAGTLEAGIADRTVQAIAGFEPDMAGLARGTAVDGLPVPALVRQLLDHVGPQNAAAVHVGATSQDVLDTGLGLALRDLSDLLGPRIGDVIEGLRALDLTNGKASLMGRTRMQAALPITVSHRIAGWLQPLHQHRERLTELRPKVEVLQLGGPVGLRDFPGGRGDEIATDMAGLLGLGCPDRAWHATRANVVEYAGWLSLVTGSLGKMAQDICLMGQQGIDEITLIGGGTSSAMNHKNNPVLAETLVAFARFNAVQISGIHQAMLHEQERSGAAWMLEWMCLPILAETTAKALTIASQLLAQIDRIGSPDQV